MFNRSAGTWVYYTGYLYTMRDGTLRKMVEDEFVFDNIYPVYFCGPSFKGKLAVGACGPTTTARMEKFFPWLISRGFDAIIGKGSLSQGAMSLIKGKMEYLLAVGGAGVVYGEVVKEYEIIAYGELGPEALLRLYVKNMPLLVAYDFSGINII